MRPGGAQGSFGPCPPCPPHPLPHSGALAHSGACSTHLAAAARRGEDLCGCRTCDKSGVWLAQGLTLGWTPPAKAPHLHTCIATSHGLTFPARAHVPLQVLIARRPGCFHRHGKHRTGTLEVGYLGGHHKASTSWSPHFPLNHQLWDPSLFGSLLTPRTTRKPTGSPPSYGYYAQATATT